MLRIAPPHNVTFLSRRAGGMLGLTQDLGVRPSAARAPGPAGVLSARRQAHTGYMSRAIGTVLGVILALWVAFMAAGWIVATLKTFLVTALVAVVVFIVVWLLAGRARRDNAGR